MAAIRARFAKLAPVRYISHLDLMRTFERAMRRAKVPLAYSEGYHPRPKFSFASALPVGVTSEAEYADIELTETWEPERFVEQVNRQLPDGIMILSAAVIPEDAPKLMSVIDRATYRCVPLCQSRGSQGDGADDSEAAPAGLGFRERLQGAVTDLLSKNVLTITRERKGKTKQVNIRPLIFDVSAVEITQGFLDRDSVSSRDMLVVQLDVASGSRGNVRPEKVLGLLPIECHWKIHRTGLYITVNGKPENPMEVDSKGG